ncbi:hypothetical protein HMPREF9554_01155 [Treponema phagedenis F0421]|nr:hypothetical protein HMPREF9554_01155 [Treponema phagedenis F0421]
MLQPVPQGTSHCALKNLPFKGRFFYVHAEIKRFLKYSTFFSKDEELKIKT